jgi:hypothetical protein
MNVAVIAVTLQEGAQPVLLARKVQTILTVQGRK